jgi:hypothetical protein
MARWTRADVVIMIEFEIELLAMAKRCGHSKSSTLLLVSASTRRGASVIDVTH